MSGLLGMIPFSMDHSASDQLTLGELVDHLEAIPAEYRSVPVFMHGFVTVTPTTLDSWRGAYKDLALGYKVCSEHGYMEEALKVQALLDDAKSAIGTTFEGYKGGEYTMTRQTPVFINNWGRCWSALGYQFYLRGVKRHTSSDGVIQMVELQIGCRND